MQLPTNTREQQKWILAETGRQLLSPITAIVRKVQDIRESIELDKRLEAALIDPTLIDRMSKQPKKITVLGEQEPEEIKVRLLRRPLSLDGILKPAC